MDELKALAERGCRMLWTHFEDEEEDPMHQVNNMLTGVLLDTDAQHWYKVDKTEFSMARFNEISAYIKEKLASPEYAGINIVTIWE